MEQLTGQVALITGCGRLQGVGRAVALALADAGVDIAACDISVGGTRNRDEGVDADQAAGWQGLTSTVAELRERGVRAEAVVGDVGQSGDVDRMVAETLDHFSRIDILVNNAAAPHGLDRTWTWEVPEDAFDTVMRVNLKGVFLMSSAVTRHLLERGEGGRIINIASNAGRVGMAKRAAYCASKFAVRGLTQSMALELAPHAITVNAVCPGFVETARNAATTARAAAGGESDPMIAAGTSSIPAGRKGQPQDIANTVRFLAGPGADYITGQTLSVDGGLIPS